MISFQAGFIKDAKHICCLVVKDWHFATTSPCSVDDVTQGWA